MQSVRCSRPLERTGLPRIRIAVRGIFQLAGAVASLLSRGSISQWHGKRLVIGPHGQMKTCASSKRIRRLERR